MTVAYSSRLASRHGLLQLTNRLDCIMVRAFVARDSLYVRVVTAYCCYDYETWGDVMTGERRGQGGMSCGVGGYCSTRHTWATVVWNNDCLRRGCFFHLLTLTSLNYDVYSFTYMGNIIYTSENSHWTIVLSDIEAASDICLKFDFCETAKSFLSLFCTTLSWFWTLESRCGQWKLIWQ